MEDKEISTKLGIRFLNAVANLEPKEFVGLARLMGVKLLTQNVDKETKKAIPRDATDILDDMIDVFAGYERKDRKFLVKRLEKITKG